LRGDRLWPGVDVGVVVIDAPQNPGRLVESHSLREGRDVEVVSGLVAAQCKPSLDPQDLRRRR
jgi:hypothetical protein